MGKRCPQCGKLLKGNYCDDCGEIAWVDYVFPKVIKSILFLAVLGFILGLFLLPESPFSSRYVKKEKANPLNILEVKDPPRLGDSFMATDIKNISSYRHLSHPQKYITLFNDNPQLGSYLFIYHSNKVLNEDHEFVSKYANNDMIYLGYDRRRDYLYGFQFNLVDPDVYRQMTLEKALILAGRYLPEKALNDAGERKFIYKYQTSTIFCYINENVTLSMVNHKNGSWIIRGMNRPSSSFCQEYPHAIPWKLNLQKIFSRSNDNLFTN